MTGLFIRALSISKMRGNNLWKICAPQKLIMTGIYKYIRHPMYTGGILMYTGLILLSTNNIFITVVMFGLIYSFVMDRIDREENMLNLIYGDIYRKYSLNTKMLIPFLL